MLARLSTSLLLWWVGICHSHSLAIDKPNEL